MLTILTNPSVLELFHTERQRRMRPTPPTGVTTPPGGMRVRLGRALIGAGSALAGERVEPARRPSTPQPRAA